MEEAREALALRAVAVAGRPLLEAGVVEPAVVTVGAATLVSHVEARRFDVFARVSAGQRLILGNCSENRLNF